MKSVLTGLVAAPYTPFRSDGELDIDVISRQAALLAHNGVSGAFVCGTTGEGCSLSISERERVVVAWQEARPPELKLVVQLGHLSLGDGRRLARHAQDSGADAIATLAPHFFRPPGVEELVRWCQQIAAAAPELPFYYYHMPAMTGVALPVTEFLRAAKDRIPTLAGVKFTHEDLMDYGRANEVDGGRYAMLFGRDEILLSGLSIGAAGAVGSTYNFAAPLFRRIWLAHQSGDLDAAKKDQSLAREFIAVLNRHGGFVAGKAVMKLIGVDCGPVRLPLRNLSDDQMSTLRDDLERVGFFEYCSQLPGAGI